MQILPDWDRRGDCPKLNQISHQISIELMHLCIVDATIYSCPAASLCRGPSINGLRPQWKRNPCMENKWATGCAKVAVRLSWWRRVQGSNCVNSKVVWKSRKRWSWDRVISLMLQRAKQHPSAAHLLPSPQTGQEYERRQYMCAACRERERMWEERAESPAVWVAALLSWSRSWLH